MSKTLRDLIVRWRALDEEKISSGMSSGNFFADELEAALAAAPDNGPACHKCGRLVEEGDILCSEHEQQMVQALISAAKSRFVSTLEVPPPLDKEQIIEIDENGKVHGDISGLKLKSKEEQ